jgi:hypothetical protein
MFEKIVEYAAKCIKKMQREGIKAMVIKKEAVDDWKEYCDNYFPKTVFATKVPSSIYFSKDSAGHGIREVKKMDRSLHSGQDLVFMG